MASLSAFLAWYWWYISSNWFSNSSNSSAESLSLSFISSSSIWISLSLASSSSLKIIFFLPLANLSNWPVFSAVFKLNNESAPIWAASIPIFISVNIFIWFLIISFCFNSLAFFFNRLAFCFCLLIKSCNSWSIFCSSVNGSTSIFGFSSSSSSSLSIPRISLACFLNLRIILNSFLPKTFKSLIHSNNSGVHNLSLLKIFHSWSWSSSLSSLSSSFGAGKSNLFKDPNWFIGSSCLIKSIIGMVWNNV